MDLNIIKSVLDADDNANSSLVALASQVCSGLEVFANIPDGIRYSIAKELVTFEEALSPPRLEDSEQVDIITVKRRRTHYEKGRSKIQTGTGDILRHRIISPMSRTLVIQKESSFVKTSPCLIKYMKHFYK